MGGNLNLFPARVPIGTASDANGRAYDVLMTPEFSRALADLLERVGGINGAGSSDIAALASFPSDGAQLAGVMAEMQALRAEIAQLSGQFAAVAEVRKYADQIKAEYAFAPTFSVPWDRPGQIGLRTPNTGSFTVLSAGTGTVALPSFYLDGDTSTGLYRVGSNNWGLSISGIKLADFSSAAAAFTQNVSTTKQIISTIAVGTPPLVVSSTTNVPNLNASSLNGATFDAPGAIGGTTSGSGKFTTFGCNGQAPQAASSLSAAATDLPTVIALANSIRTALTANGIGS